MRSIIITALLLIPSTALAGHPHMSRNNWDLLMYNRSFDIGGAVRGSVHSYRFLNGQPLPLRETSPSYGVSEPIVSPWQPRNRRRRAGSNLEMRIKRAERKRQEKAERRARRRAERLAEQQ